MISWPAMHAFERRGPLDADSSRLASDPTARRPLGSPIPSLLTCFALFLVSGSLARAFDPIGTAEAGVLSPPSFDTHPRSLDLEAGDILALTAYATGSTPLTFTWYQDTTPLSTTSGPDHATALTLLTVEPRHAGNYVVVARNLAGAVTSQVARVTVKPAPPNPEHRGRRFVHFAETGQPVGSSPERPTTLGNRGVRWWGNQLLFTALSNPGEKPMGLLAATQDGPRVVLAPGTELPHGLGVLGTVALPTGARRDDPIVFLGFAGTHTEAAGIYRWTDGALMALVDTTSEVPGAGSERFTRWGELAQRGESVLFTATTGNRWGVYRWTPEGARRLADTTQVLPHVELRTSAFVLPTLDDTHAAVSLWNDRTGYLGVLRFGPAGEMETILRRDEPIPDTSETIQDGGWLALDAGVVYQSAPGPSIREWRNGRIRRLVGPLSIVENSGFVRGGGHTPIFLDAGILYTRLELGPGSFHQIVRWTPDGRLEGMPLTKLDGRVVGTSFFDGVLHGVDRGQLAVTVRFTQPFSDDRPFALYGNLVPVLHAARSGPETLRVEIPEGAQLETSATGSSPWEPFAGSDAISIPTTAPQRFFRARQP